MDIEELLQKLLNRIKGRLHSNAYQSGYDAENTALEAMDEIFSMVLAEIQRDKAKQEPASNREAAEVLMDPPKFPKFPPTPPPNRLIKEGEQPKPLKQPISLSLDDFDW